MIDVSPIYRTPVFMNFEHLVYLECLMLERSQMCYELKERLIHLDCVVLYTQNCFSGVSNLFYCYHSLRIVFIS